MISDSSFLALMHSKIPTRLKHDRFGGTFRQAIPFLMRAYYETLEEIEPSIPSEIRDDLINVIGELSHPVPEKRGNPQYLSIIKHKPYSLEKYISIIDRLAKKISWVTK
jgi:hypothetical protein